MSDAVAARPHHNGRRVLFVDPPSVIQQQMIHFLVTAQYEAAIVRDPRRVPQAIRAFPRPLVYFNLESRFSASELEQIARAAIAQRETHGVEVGILSYNPAPELARRYLMELDATGGHIVLALGFEKSARMIVRALEASEARGSRRFVRVAAPADKALLNIDTGAGVVSGTIIDISQAGMACTLSEQFSQGTYFGDIQLQLWGTLCRTGGTLVGSRTTDKAPVSLIMFDEKMESTTRGKIIAFAKRAMQHEVDRVVGT